MTDKQMGQRVCCASNAAAASTCSCEENGGFLFAFDNGKFSDRVLCLTLSSAKVDNTQEQAKACALPIDVEPLDAEVDVVREKKVGTHMGACTADVVVGPAASQKSNTRIETALPVWRRIAVSSIVLAKESTFFRRMFTNGMIESKEIDIPVQLADEQEAKLFVTLLRAAYNIATLRCVAETEYLPLMFLADRFGLESILAACSQKLCTGMQVETCLACFQLPDAIYLSEACAGLRSKAKSVVATEFRDLQSTFRSERFLQLPHKAVVELLGGDYMPSEATAYQAARWWWTHSPLSPIADHKARDSTGADSKQQQQKDQSSQQKRLDEVSSATAELAVKLLAAVRFPMLSSDFLLDVVRHDTAFLGRALIADAKGIDSTTSNARDVLRDRLNQAIEFRACSTKRRLLLSQPGRLLESTFAAGTCPQFVSRSAPQKTSFEWRIENVSKMIKGQYVFSQSFPVAGYFMRLQSGRILWERKDADSFALFLSLDVEQSGLSCDRDFLLQTESQFHVRDTHSKSWVSTHLPSVDTFVRSVNELGYFDVFKKSWDEFINPSARMVNEFDCIELRVEVQVAHP